MITINKKEPKIKPLIIHHNQLQDEQQVKFNL